MVTTNDLLDLLKDKLGSDYKTAQRLGMTTQRISYLRHKGGTFTDEQGLQVASILDFPAEAIILSLAAERSLKSPAFDLLNDLADRFDPRKTAAAVAAFLLPAMAFISSIPGPMMV